MHLFRKFINTKLKTAFIKLKTKLTIYFKKNYVNVK